MFEDEGGRLLEWTSRRHRKGLGLRAADEAAAVARVGMRDALAYHGLNWWIGWLFMIGSTCFAVGSMPVYATHVDPGVDGITFFVGSLFFTSAALLQHIQTVTADRGVGGAEAGGHLACCACCASRRASTGGRPASSWSGTLWFNITTFAALNDSFDYQKEIVRIWTPDALGSICFLVASYLALAEVTHGVRLWDPDDSGWRIAALNMLGSIFFGISAVASFILPSTGERAERRGHQPLHVPGRDLLLRRRVDAAPRGGRKCVAGTKWTDRSVSSRVTNGPSSPFSIREPPVSTAPPARPRPCTTAAGWSSSSSASPSSWSSSTRRSSNVALPSIQTGPRLLAQLAAVGRQRLHARLRRLPAARRPRRRLPRAAPRCSWPASSSSPAPRCLNGLAPSSEWLIVARALQGLGAAMVSPAALSIVTTTFREGAERAKALASGPRSPSAAPPSACCSAAS